MAYRGLVSTVLDTVWGPAGCFSDQLSRLVAKPGRGLMSDSSWPYPSYADRRWLGGERGADRSLAAVIRALRTAVSEAGDPVSGDPEALLAALTHLAAIAERVDW